LGRKITTTKKCNKKKDKSFNSWALIKNFFKR
jgi:hypothetical protein